MTKVYIVALLKTVDLGKAHEAAAGSQCPIKYSESYSTRREAMLREKHLKSIGGVKEKKTIIKKITEGL